MPATILVCDDDSAIRTVLNQALGRAGYDVRTTGTAAGLWRWISAGEGNLVITDVVLPDESGFDLIPRIKRMRPDLPILVMSAQNTLLTAITAAERGAFEYLPKPFDLKELTSVVNRALASPQGKRDTSLEAAEETQRRGDCQRHGDQGGKAEERHGGEGIAHMAPDTGDFVGGIAGQHHDARIFCHGDGNARRQRLWRHQRLEPDRRGIVEPADFGLHDGLAGLVDQRGAHMALAFEARHHLAQGDGVLDIGLQGVADRMAGPVKGGAHLQLDHRLGVQRQKPRPRRQGQQQEQGDRSDQPQLQ